MTRTRPDTVCAPATAPGRAALAVVRVSGPAAPAVLARVFPAARGRRLEPRRAVTGWLVDEHGRLLDQAVVTCWPGPNSYTGENLVEFSCHGSPLVVDRLLVALEGAGCRRAGPGEFTRRAVLAGKLTVARAEAVADIIEACSEPALESALNRYRDGAAVAVRELVAELRELVAAFEFHVGVDDSDGPLAPGLGRQQAALVRRLDALIRAGERNRLLHEGCRLAIVGRPNVGKSSLFNRLAGADRAIVAPAPGTTRDRIEARVLLGGVPVLLADTAGITARRSGALARAAAARTAEALAGCDLALVVFDGSEPARPADRSVLAAVAGRPAFTVVNKSDRPARFDTGTLNGRPRFTVSALTGTGIGRLRGALARRLRPEPGCPLASGRAVEALRDCRAALERSAAAPDPEIAACELRAALESLDRVEGPDAGAEVLDRVFSRFCVGK